MQPRRLVGQQQACMTGKLDGLEGKAQVNTAALGPARAVGSAAKDLAAGDPKGSRKGRVQSSTFKYVPDTDGKARLGKMPTPPAVQQADDETLP